MRSTALPSFMSGTMSISTALPVLRATSVLILSMAWVEEWPVLMALAIVNVTGSAFDADTTTTTAIAAPAIERAIRTILPLLLNEREVRSGKYSDMEFRLVVFSREGELSWRRATGNCCRLYRH